METPLSARPLMASYLDRWEEQKAQIRRERERQARRRSSDVGDELSFISAIEREAAQQERHGGAVETARRPWEEDNDDDFNLPAVDTFPGSPFTQDAREMLQQTEMPADDEFEDAATFLKKNELGGDDSFSQDVAATALLPADDWDQNTSGRPSDFFERKSRNMDYVELSSPKDEAISAMQCGDVEGENVDEDEQRDSMPKEQGSPSDLQQGVALYDRFDRSSGLSGTGTALSSGYDVHFDNARLVYTPNSMKYLQERNRFKSANAMHTDNKVSNSIADHTGEAEQVIRTSSPPPEPEIPEDASPEYVATLQRGPGVIKEALHEIDALIDSSNRLAASPPRKASLNANLTEDMRDFVRSYELPLESMLPLSRTTDSWGEDVSGSQIDDDMNRRSRDLECISNSTEPKRPTLKGISRRRSQETPELDTIREIPMTSHADLVSQSQKPTDLHSRKQRTPHSPTQDEIDSIDGASKTYGSHARDVRAKRSSTPKPRAVQRSAALDRSLAEVAATQNPFHDEMHHSLREDLHSEQPEDDDESVFAETAECENDNFGSARATNDEEQDQDAASESDDIDLIGLRFRYGVNPQSPRRALRRKHVDIRPRARDGREAKTTAVQKHSSPSDRLLDVLDRNQIHVAIETAKIPRRCRRFLCSTGDVMTEQVVFTNGTNSVGRICVSLLPLSTGCQQFSVSPAVLELGPKASSAFHVTFSARYMGAVSGIFQFRGVGIESLFRPYEVVIEASVKRNLKLEGPKIPRSARQQHQSSERVQELQTSTSVDQVQISPMFIRFDRVRNKSGDQTIRQAKLRLSNNTAQTLPFKVRALENLKVRPAAGMIQPASEVIVSVLPIFQPFVQQRSEGEMGSTHPSPRAEDWYGSLTVRVGKSFSREVSVVVDRRVSIMLPPFDEIARSRHQISTQTDSFYYTKRGKRRGLYFHARAVEFGCCNVGESHEVPVYVCNGSKAPMTVFLQDLQEPFSCSYSTTTIEPRKFIEVMVAFTPKVVGKVATSLFAYSVSDKAVVTLVARGI